jgi:hypothetical protein
MTPSSTQINYGNDLGEEPQLQLGWSVEADGFGLLQAQVKFKWDITKMNLFPTTFAKGVLMSTLIPGIDTKYQNMGVWKASMVVEKGGVLMITADFAGIDPAFNSGTKTETQVVMTGSSASEAIEHHPNFLKINMESGGLYGRNPMAGFPTGDGWDNSTTTNPNRALWRPYVASQGAEQGFQFVGFLPPQKSTDPLNIKAGIKNYYKPSNTLRLLFYVSTESAAVAFASYVGWVNNGKLYGLPDAYVLLTTTGYGGTFVYSTEWAAKIHKSFLITNCSVERFGAIWKVTADLMLSGIAGWDQDIYPFLNTP